MYAFIIKIMFYFILKNFFQVRSGFIQRDTHPIDRIQSISKGENSLGKNTLHRQSLGHLRRGEAKNYFLKGSNNKKKRILNTKFIYLFIGHAAACGNQFPDQGLDPGPQQRKGTVLTTGLPENSLNTKFRIVVSSGGDSGDGTEKDTLSVMF